MPDPVADGSANSFRRDARARAAWLVSIGLLVVAIALNVAVLRDLIVDGPFRWHFRTPGAVQGGAEVVGLAIVLFGALCVRRAGWRLALVALLVVVYWRRHGVDGPALAGIAYVEWIVAVGALLSRGIGLRASTTDTDDVVHALTFGIGGVAAVLLIASIVGVGTAPDLRVVVAMLAMPVFAFARARPLSVRAIDAIGDARVGVRLLGAALVAWFASIFARTNHVMSYDSLWYGLRGEIVLAPARSLFDDTGLSAVVYYYPKLTELLMLPLSGLDDFSFPLAFNAAMFAALAGVAFVVARRFGAGATGAMIGVALVATLPALANLALTAKGDVLSMLCLLLAVCHADAFIARRSWSFAVVALIATGYAVLAKLASAPFGVAILVAMLGARAWRRSRASSAASVANGPGVDEAPSPADARSWRRAASLAAVSMLLVGGALTARTWRLTGLPTIGPEPLYQLWLALGFALREPAGTLAWLTPAVWSETPRIAQQFLVAPSGLSHVVIAWTGNAWLWLALVASIARVPRGALAPASAGRYALVALVVAVGLWLALGQRYMGRVGDGNHVMFAPILATLALAAFVPMLARRLRGGVVLFAAVACFVVFQAAYAFVSANWDAPGTRALDARFDRGVIDTPGAVRAQLATDGLVEIADFLATQPVTTRIVGYTDNDADCFLMPVRCEPVSNIFNVHPEYFYGTRADYERFLAIARIDGVILPRKPRAALTAELAPMVVADAWRRRADVISVTSRDYELLLRRRE